MLLASPDFVAQHQLTDNSVHLKLCALHLLPVCRSLSKERLKKPIVDFTLSLRQLSNQFNTPCISERLVDYGQLDMNALFPRLYIPADFVKMVVDWGSCRQFCSFNGDVQRITAPVPHLLETAPSTLSTSIPKHLQTDRPPKGSLLEAVFPGGRQCPVKFNVRVIISLGLVPEDKAKNPVASTDYVSPRKLRLLLGKRKGSETLLGGAWSQELDGGDPLADRSCLLATARRSVRAASLCDVGRYASFSKLFEVYYHRPTETYEGKTFKEQEEITVVFMCTLSPVNCSEDDFAEEWTVFLKRCSGESIGPRHSLIDMPATPALPAAAEALSAVEGGSFADDEGEIDETPPVAEASTAIARSKSDETEVKPTREKPESALLLLCPQPESADKKLDVGFPSTCASRLIVFVEHLPQRAVTRS